MNSGKEYHPFEALALPFKRRLYRTALILTKSSRHARELVQETYLSARKDYEQLEPDIDFDFGVWLS
jgi:DNA-directed RNA polymerase specialized sigma24 family protein